MGGMDDVWHVDGTLEPIAFDGFADDRSPLELAARAVERWSSPGDWVLDPFAGLGTTLFAAASLNRRAIGIEPNPERLSYLQSRLPAPHRIIPGKAQAVDPATLPPIGLLLCSPPYPTVHLADDPWGPTYFDDMAEIFSRLAVALAGDARVVVEVSNIRTADGFRPLIAQFSSLLGAIFPQVDEVARINRSGWPAGPGTGWSSLLVFAPPAAH
jgi:hypothetical protein